MVSGKSLLTIINDILDLSKIEAGKLEINLESVYLDSVLNDLKQMFSLRISQKNIDFKVIADQDLPSAILIDEIRLRQILINLIGNAIKFTDEGTVKLVISHKRIDDNNLNISFIVSDTGIGIPIEQQERIFESFEQQDGQNTKHYGGTGLGLAISKRLVEMMGGTINCSSTVGIGTRFTVVFNNIEQTTMNFSSTPKQEINTENIKFEKANILITDDNKYNRELLTECLIGTGINIIEAENGIEAIEALRTKPVDIIIMDLKMPKMSGFEAIKIIRSEKKYSKLPVLAITASVMSTEKDRILESGFNEYMIKPIDIEQLIIILSKYLKHSVVKVKRDNTTHEQDFKMDFKNIDMKMIGDISELIKSIDENLLPIWKEVHVKQSNRNIKLFSEKLSEVAKKFNIIELDRYGKNIEELYNNFEIPRLRINLELFIQWYNNLQKQI